MTAEKGADKKESLNNLKINDNLKKVTGIPDKLSSVTNPGETERGGKWEYHIEKTERDYIPDINTLGLEGWELVAVVPLVQEHGWQDYKYFFKRKIATEKGEDKCGYKTHRKSRWDKTCGYCGAEMYFNNLGSWRCPNDKKRARGEKEHKRLPFGPRPYGQGVRMKKVIKE